MKRKKGEDETENDADQEFLDEVLNKLYDFGDGSDNKHSKKKRKKGKKKNTDGEDADDEDNFTNQTNCEKEETNLSHVTDRSCDSVPCATTSTDFRSETSERRVSNVEVVTFQDPLKKNKLKKTEEPEANTPEVKDQKKNEANEMSIEKARLDVHRFGITGFQKQQQRVFEQDRAIMLGAQPPKREFVNYKVYQQMMKERKMTEQQEIKLDPQNKKKQPRQQKYVKHKSSSTKAEPTGQVGHFKNGMLVLSAKDIQKMKGKVRK